MSVKSTQICIGGEGVAALEGEEHLDIFNGDAVVKSFMLFFPQKAPNQRNTGSSQPCFLLSKNRCACAGRGDRERETEKCGSFSLAEGA